MNRYSCFPLLQYVLTSCIISPIYFHKAIYSCISFYALVLHCANEGNVSQSQSQHSRTRENNKQFWLPTFIFKFIFNAF